MAFLAYVLRGPHLSVKDYVDQFPEACVRLLRDCSPEDVGTRKELLVAIRHILTVESRSNFIPWIDYLLEERILVGTGVTSRESLRPLGYSVVADLIHHVRGELNIGQLARIVHVFSCNLNDPTFTSAIQTMCAKLLNTICESIHKAAEPAESTRIMRSMFHTCLQKLVALTEAFERLRTLQAIDKKEQAKEVSGDADGDTKMEDGSVELSAEEKQARGWQKIEQAMPAGGVAYVNDSLESFAKGERHHQPV